MKILILFILFLASCSSQFSNPVNMPLIEMNSEYAVTSGTHPIYVQEVVDSRKIKEFLNHSESKYESHADIGPVVREALSQALGKKGYKITNKAKYVLKLEVVSWNASVEDNTFVSELKSSAEIKLTVFEIKGNKVYSGKYSGESQLEKFNFSNESLVQALALSMKQSIDTLIGDKNLGKLLSNV